MQRIRRGRTGRRRYTYGSAFHPALAPVKIGVLPLSKKLNEGAEKVFAELSKTYNCEFDDRGNIGKRYRRQDEIGTPFCVTYDFDSEEDGAVTVRDRDTMEQERVKIEDLKAYFEKSLSFSMRLPHMLCGSFLAEVLLQLLWQYIRCAS